MMPMLKIVMVFLNLGQTISLNPPPPKQPLISCGLFNVVVSTQEVIEGLFRSRLSLFHGFHVENVYFIDPLMWRAANEFRFPNMGFLAQHIVGILGSQFDTERIFVVVHVFISLQ
jgi:hypothetical protein